MSKKLSFRFRTALCLTIFFAATMFGLLATNIRAASLAPAQDRIVVIVSVDGMASFYLNDPKADLPTMRQLAAEGAAAQKMKTSLPTSTWPNHATLVTGVSPRQHGVLANHYWDREQDKTFALIADPIFNESEIVKVPTLYDVAHAAGLKTAGINWPATRGAKGLDLRTPDVQNNTIFAQHSTPSLLEEFRAEKIPFERLEEFCKAGKYRERDVMNTKMLLHVIQKHRPNLALLHLMEVDHAEHEDGPRADSVYESLRVADGYVKQIRDALEKEFPGRATLIVTADHGFASVRQKIQPNVKFRQEGLLKVQDGKMTQRRAFALSQGGSCFIYILDKAHRADLSRQIAGMFKGVEGIDQVLLPRDYKKFGIASPEEDPRMADIVLTAKDGFAFSNSATEDLVVTPKSNKVTGVHGNSPLLPDLYAAFIAWGAGVQKNVNLGQIENVDVAPSAAHLLGLKMKNTEGRVLKRMLEK